LIGRFSSVAYVATAGAASKPPVTRMEHERRVSARLTRGVAADIDLPKRLAAASGTGRYHVGRDAPGPVLGTATGNSLGESRPGGALASKDDISMQRSTRQPKK